MTDPIVDLFQNDYAQIISMARARLARERSPISTMTLVHELYLNLNDRNDLRFGTREQFLAYASRAMRSLLRRAAPAHLGAGCGGCGRHAGAIGTAG
jgi:hypothetical protein